MNEKLRQSYFRVIRIGNGRGRAFRFVHRAAVAGLPTGRILRTLISRISRCDVSHA